MTELIPYSAAYREPTIKRIACFFGLHAALLGQASTQTQKELTEAAATLAGWLLPSHKLYMISFEETIVGFLHICYRGDIAICLDVVPRNRAALALYHKLGYDNLSLLTVRKELYENKRDQKEQVLGFEFNC